MHCDGGELRNWKLVVVRGADHVNGKMAIGAAPVIP
jgi:hypothetical protein